MKPLAKTHAVLSPIQLAALNYSSDRSDHNARAVAHLIHASDDRDLKLDAFHSLLLSPVLGAHDIAEPVLSAVTRAALRRST